MWAYLRYVEKPEPGRYLAVCAAFLLSLLSKPMLLTLPFILLLLDYWPLRRLPSRTPFSGVVQGLAVAPASIDRIVLEKLPLFVLAGLIGVLTLVTRFQMDAIIPLSDIPLSARLATALTAYGWYLAHTFVPMRLGVYYPHPLTNWEILPAVVGAGILLSVTLFCWRRADRSPWLLVGWLWFAGSLVPVLGLAQGGRHAWADRFTYWPHIGLFVALVWGMNELVERWRIPSLVSGITGVLILGCLGGITWAQVGYWRDTITLWERALAVTANNDLAHLSLSNCYMLQRRFDLAEAHLVETLRIQLEPPAFHQRLGVYWLELGRLDEAADQFEQALQLAPDSADANYNLGITRLRQGQPAAARRCFRKVLESEPELADALAGLGFALFREGKRDEALRTLESALCINPKDAEAWRGVGLVQLARGELHEALRACEQAVQANPKCIPAYSEMGVALGRCGQWPQAVYCHRTALAKQQQAEEILASRNGRPLVVDSTPQSVLFRCRLAFALQHTPLSHLASVEYRAALEKALDWPQRFSEQARQLATDPDVDCRDCQLAFELASQAVGASSDPSAPLLDTLALTQAALGHFQEAVQTAEQALSKALATGQPALATSIRGRLLLYGQGKPSSSPQ
jgi:tetratricopeptide (TPR) repeat protein